MKKLKNARITIVGLGLMGGSLAGALRHKCRTVTGVTRRMETIETALARGLIDRGTTDWQRGVRQSDVVILATPVRVILELLAEIGPYLPEGCLLMDLGSTKAQIVAAMAQLPSHVQPLGGHPMCGREVSGIAEADPTLYVGHPFILTPLPRTSQEALAQGRTLAEAVGARPLVLAPERHDQLVATISHLPYLLACGLVATAQSKAADDPLVWEIAASGFHDTSRLAASNTTMMLDILLTNRQAILAALNTCEAQLRHLAHLLECGAEEDLRTALHLIRECRRDLPASPLPQA